MKATRRRQAAVGGLAALGLLGGFLADRAVGQRRATRLGAQLRADAVALAGCMYGASLPTAEREERTLRERLGRLAPGDEPFAGCVPAALGLEASLHELSVTRHRRSGDRPAQVDTSVDALEALPLQGTAVSLQARVAELATSLRATLAGACAIATTEDGDSACLPAPGRPVERPSQVVFDEPTADAPAAWVVTAGEADISLRVASGGHAWEARSSDRGRTFAALALPGQAPGVEAAPQLIDEAPGRRRLVRSLAAGVSWGELIEVSGATAQTRPLPALPGGASPAPLGVRAVETPDGWVSVGRDESGRGVLSWGPESDARRAAPEGELLGAFQQGGARLLLGRRARSGFVELVTVPVPGRRAPWASGLSAVVAYVPELHATADVERRCGLPDERFSAWVGTAGQDAALVASSSAVLHSYRFRASPQTRYGVICGSCPPMALEVSSDGLGLFVPVRRSLTPARLTTPLLFEPGRSDVTAQGACTPSALAVVYEAGGQIVVQRREERGWRFEPPVVMAETDERGRPEAPAIVGVGETLVVFWRRLTPGRLRIEARSLDDLPREPIAAPPRAPPDHPASSGHRGRGGRSGVRAGPTSHPGVGLRSV